MSTSNSGKIFQAQRSDFHCTSLFSASHADEFRLPLPVGAFPSFAFVFLLATLRSSDFHSSCSSSSDSTLTIGINGAQSGGRVTGVTVVSCFGTEVVQKLFLENLVKDSDLVSNGNPVTIEYALGMNGVEVNLRMDLPAMLLVCKVEYVNKDNNSQISVVANTQQRIVLEEQRSGAQSCEQLKTMPMK